MSDISSFKTNLLVLMTLTLVNYFVIHIFLKNHYLLDYLAHLSQQEQLLVYQYLSTPIASFKFDFVA